MALIESGIKTENVVIVASTQVRRLDVRVQAAFGAAGYLSEKSVFMIPK